MCMTRRGRRSLSTGGHQSPGPSTGPARVSRWACGCGAGSGSPGATLPPTRTRPSRGSVSAGRTWEATHGAAGRLAGEKQPSTLLVAEIERPRSGPMRDIVATIQPDQDEIVRADAGQTVCVQGAPGTGKTAVGLHRVAYLLYAHKERVTRRGVIVVGPNLAFLSYIRNVLPALGELDVTQTTVTELVALGAGTRRRQRRGGAGQGRRADGGGAAAGGCGRRSGRRPRPACRGPRRPPLAGVRPPRLARSRPNCESAECATERDVSCSGTGSRT